MREFVLDASVALAWYVDDPEPAYAIRVRRALEAGSRAIVPPLWALEMANGLSMAERRGKLTVEQVDGGLHQLEKLTMSAIKVESETTTVREALAGSRASRLTAYDAVYLEFARRRGLSLATLDAALRAAAEKAGVGVMT